MLITMNTVYAGPDPFTGSPVCLRPGQVVDFPADKARELVAGNFAFDHIALEEAAKAELEAKRLAKAAGEENDGTTSRKPPRKKPAGDG